MSDCPNPVRDAMRLTWRPIDTAPRGHTETRPGPKGERHIHIAEWIYTGRKADGHVTKSCWLPKEERWNGWTAEGGPDLWQPIILPEVP
jgi:hypothetical protein